MAKQRVLSVGNLRPWPNFALDVHFLDHPPCCLQHWRSQRWGPKRQLSWTTAKLARKNPIARVSPCRDNQTASCPYTSCVPDTLCRAVSFPFCHIGDPATSHRGAKRARENEAHQTIRDSRIQVEISMSGKIIELAVCARFSRWSA